MHTTDQVAVAATLYACIGEVLCLNLVGHTGNPDWYPSLFFRVSPAEALGKHSDYAKAVCFLTLCNYL
jgi:hypothetical protein